MRSRLIIIATLIASTTMAQPVEKINYLALGDSYTIGESVPDDQRWPVQLAQRLTAKGIPMATPRIIATTGWRTDDLKRAILAAEITDHFNLVSLLIGVNNQYQGKSLTDYGIEFEDLLQMAIGFADGDTSRVFVVSIPDYGYTPFGLDKKASITAFIDKFNEVNRIIAEKYHVKYFDITPISRQGLNNPQLIASDGLHPSGKMYEAWVDLIAPQLESHLK